MEPSQRRNGKHDDAEHCYDNLRYLYLNSETKHGISMATRYDEGSPPPAGRSLGCMNLCLPPPEVLYYRYGQVTRE